MTVESPCINVCVMDPASSYCIGCGRTIEEIARWGGLSSDSRRSVLLTLPERMKVMTSREGRGRKSGRSAR